MKKIFITSIIFFLIALIACKKDTKTADVNPTAPSQPTDNYSSIKDFYSKNKVAMQTYTINANFGGSFNTPQGTTVTIPANAFLTQTSASITGVVTIQFKDIYKKSDMLLSKIPTNTYGGAPLKSGGEFFIKVIQNNTALILAPGKNIDVFQPIPVNLIGGLDTMQPFIRVDSIGGGGNPGWMTANTNSILNNASNYVFSLYNFNTPSDSGSWCNSDNSSYFSAYPQTTLNLISTDSYSVFSTDVFLVFKNISSMVHVYYNYGTGYNNFLYSYAPQGLQCTMVAVGIKDGALYSSFVPITIGANQTYSFALNPTTTSTFTNQLNTLN